MQDTLTFHFQKSGMQTTLQDMGRSDFREYGIPVSGAMDKHSMKIANWLVANPLDYPVLEITLMGPKIAVEGNGQIAVTGANLSPMVNSHSIPMYETINIRNGDVISFGKPQSDCRAYLAARGLFLVDSWLGSKSASAYTGKEAIPQSTIGKGDALKIKPKALIPKRIFREDYRAAFSREPIIRVLPGPEFQYFSRELIAYFFGTTYSLSAHSNRMGYRLEPPLSGLDSNQSIISSGIVPGTVQITPSGHPIVLMMDAQTTGGYPRIANVITPDLDILGQLKPGDRFRFELIDLKSAEEILEKQKAFETKLFSEP